MVLLYTLLDHCLKKFTQPCDFFLTQQLVGSYVIQCCAFFFKQRSKSLAFNRIKHRMIGSTHVSFNFGVFCFVLFCFLFLFVCLFVFWVFFGFCFLAWYFVWTFGHSAPEWTDGDYDLNWSYLDTTQTSSPLFFTTWIWTVKVKCYYFLCFKKMFNRKDSNKESQLKFAFLESSRSVITQLKWGKVEFQFSRLKKQFGDVCLIEQIFC